MFSSICWLFSIKVTQIQIWQTNKVYRQGTLLRLTSPLCSFLCDWSMSACCTTSLINHSTNRNKLFDWVKCRHLKTYTVLPEMCNACITPVWMSWPTLNKQRYFNQSIAFHMTIFQLSFCNIIYRLTSLVLIFGWCTV